MLFNRFDIDDSGKIDILVHNAGCNVRKPAIEVTWDDWNLVLETNLRGTFFTAQAVARTAVARTAVARTMIPAGTVGSSTSAR